MYLARESIALCFSTETKIFMFFGFSQNISVIFSDLAKAFRLFHFYPDLKDRGNREAY